MLKGRRTTTPYTAITLVPGAAPGSGTNAPTALDAGSDPGSFVELLQPTGQKVCSTPCPIPRHPLRARPVPGAPPGFPVSVPEMPGRLHQDNLGDNRRAQYSSCPCFTWSLQRILGHARMRGCGNRGRPRGEARPLIFTGSRSRRSTPCPQRAYRSRRPSQKGRSRSPARSRRSRLIPQAAPPPGAPRPPDLAAPRSPPSWFPCPSPSCVHRAASIGHPHSKRRNDLGKDAAIIPSMQHHGRDAVGVASGIRQGLEGLVGPR